MPFASGSYGTGYYSGYSPISALDGYMDNHTIRAFERLKHVNKVFYDPVTQEIYLNDPDTGERMSHSYNLGSIIQVPAKRMQAIEDALRFILQHLNLDSATGYSLNIIGKIVGLRRKDVPGALYDDVIYRRSLKAKIRLYFGQGDEPSLSEGLSGLVNSDNTTVQELFPASFIYYTQGDVINESFVYNMMYNAKGEGIGMQLVNAVRSALNPFVTANNPLFHLQCAANIDVNRVSIPVLSVPGVVAGNYANGQVAIYDGTASGDVRTIDSNGATLGAGVWHFYVTVPFSAAPDATSYTNLYDQADGLGCSSNPQLNISASGGGVNYIETATVFAPGDRANDWIVIYDGPGYGDIRQIDSSGATASGPNWRFTVTETFSDNPTASSEFDIHGAGGRLAAVIEP